VSRLLQVLALTLALLVVGAPSWISELVEDHCGEDCAGDEAAGGCEERGCTDCPVVCGACARSHMLPPVAVQRLESVAARYVAVASDAPERFPSEPPPQGIFHPPRAG